MDPLKNNKKKTLTHKKHNSIVKTKIRFSSTPLSENLVIGLNRSLTKWRHRYSRPFLRSLKHASNVLKPEAVIGEKQKNLMFLFFKKSQK